MQVRRLYAGVNHLGAALVHELWVLQIDMLRPRGRVGGREVKNKKFHSEFAAVLGSGHLQPPGPHPKGPCRTHAFCTTCVVPVLLTDSRRYNTHW